jgi:methylmalonyl-CoA mutase cobalamin-binding subunit
MMSTFSTPPLAVDIATAAQMVGISRAQFYRLYLTPGRVRALRTGGRDRVIDVGELCAAYELLKRELRASEAA